MPTSSSSPQAVALIRRGWVTQVPSLSSVLGSLGAGGRLRSRLAQGLAAQGSSGSGGKAGATVVGGLRG